MARGSGTIGSRASPEGRMDWHELMKKKITELREMAKAQGMEGTSGLTKDKLVEALAHKLGIERPHLVAEGTDKTTIKQKIRALRVDIAKALEAHDHQLAHDKRRRIHHLKRQIRRATGTGLSSSFVRRQRQRPQRFGRICSPGSG